MYTINKITSNTTVDFAAEELKKYLRMMMPDCGEIDIFYAPLATDGFRLGLMSDFGIDTSEAEDTDLDDILHIDTDLSGGIIAGSNPRSVLFAVYRYLWLNGCRWLYPGIDGEFIPVNDIKPISYHKMADHRFRGQCNEGAESQQCMIETIDFYAKLGMNVYMLEFDNPFTYYNNYYAHKFNTANRLPEPVSEQTVMQWKRQCEAEIAKRGLQFHDMGHGWTAEPFGLVSTKGWDSDFETVFTDEQLKYTAMLDGKRGLFKGVALNTNFCMSDQRARSIMADAVVEYAKKHTNVDYIHVWLADGSNNHCECDECVKKRPSDWYIMVMNEIDDKLTALGLNSKITFIAYVDTLWEPETERIKNPKRFSLLYAPITSNYLSSTSEIGKTTPYVRNKLSMPATREENNAYLNAWKKVWDGPCFSYEYHFWIHQYYDPAAMYFAKRIYDDIHVLRDLGVDGFVEDGSQRSFFPNGLSMYVFAEALFDTDRSYEDIFEDYMSHAYGSIWKDVAKYLSDLSDAFDFPFMSGKLPNKHYAPERVDNLKAVYDIIEKGRPLIEENLNMPYRVQTVSLRLLMRHIPYCEGIAKFMIEKAQGNEDKALELGKKFFEEFGKYELEIERYYDQRTAYHSLKRIFTVKRNPDPTQA